MEEDICQRPRNDTTETNAVCQFDVCVLRVATLPWWKVQSAWSWFFQDRSKKIRTRAPAVPKLVRTHVYRSRVAVEIPRSAVTGWWGSVRFQCKKCPSSISEKNSETISVKFPQTFVFLPAWNIEHRDTVRIPLSEMNLMQVEALSSWGAEELFANFAMESLMFHLQRHWSGSRCICSVFPFTRVGTDCRTSTSLCKRTSTPISRDFLRTKQLLCVKQTSLKWQASLFKERKLCSVFLAMHPSRLIPCGWSLFLLRCLAEDFLLNCSL